MTQANTDSLGAPVKEGFKINLDEAYQATELEARVLAEATGLSVNQIMRCDAAGNGYYLLDKLTSFKQNLVRSVTPNLTGLNLLSKTKIADDALLYQWQSISDLGYQKVITSESDDLPTSDVSTKTHTAKVVDIGGSYYFSQYDLRAAAANHGALPTDRALADRESADLAMNKIALFGNPTTQTYGLVDNPSIATETVMTPWENLSNGKDLVDAVSDAIETVDAQSKGTIEANFCAVPKTIFRKLARTLLNDQGNSEVTVLEQLRKIYPAVTFRPVWEFEKGNTPSGQAVVIVGDNRAENAEFVIAQYYQQLPAQFVNLRVKILSTSRTAGTAIYRPQAFHQINISD